MRAINNKTVSELVNSGRVHAGFIVDQHWFKVIVNKKGQPYPLAIMIYADIVDWFMPFYDKQTHSYKQKFNGDTLKLSYSDIANKFGIGKETAKDAVNTLKSLKLIDVEFRTLIINNIPYNNVMFINLNYFNYIQSTLEDKLPPMGVEVGEGGVQEGGGGRGVEVGEGGGVLTPDEIHQQPTQQPTLKTKRKKEKESLETFFNYEGFSEDEKKAIKDWFKYKEEKGQKYKSATSMKSFRTRMQQMSNIVEAITHSMANNYNGVFEAKKFNQSSKTRHQTIAEKLFRPNVMDRPDEEL